MAALRAGVKTVIIPVDNEIDLEEIDQTVRARLSFVTAENVDDILDVALNRKKGETELAAPIPAIGQERIAVRQ
jgi:ATP-dependent Lon protease